MSSMDADYYQVNVLHYLNPHLIWVEVLKSAESDKGTLLEQIGIYELLPLGNVDNVDLGDIKPVRSEMWIPSVSVLMKKFFEEADEVWFSPTHIEKRTSIFDNNVHKFGEIIIKKSGGKCKKLSKALISYGYAFKDEYLFIKVLRSGNLKINLNNTQIADVVEILKKYGKNESRKNWKNSIKKQTSIFHSAYKLEANLTMKNLQKHDEIYSDKYTSTQVMLEKKLKDFSLCKDIEEVSLGRAHKLKEVQSETFKTVYLTNDLKNNNESQILHLSNKNITDKEPIGNTSLLQKVLATKKFQKNVQSKKVSQTEEAYVRNDIGEDNIVEDTKNIRHSEDIKLSEYDNDKPLRDVDKKIEKIRDIDISGKNLRVEDDENPEKSFKPLNKLMTKKFCYGPPEIHKSKLVIKDCSNQEDLLFLKSRPPKQIEDVKKIDNLYGDVDSELNCAISIKDNLRENVEIEQKTFKECKKIQDLANFNQSIVMSHEKNEYSLLKSESCKKNVNLTKENLNKDQEEYKSYLNDIDINLKEANVSVAQRSINEVTVESSDMHVEEKINKSRSDITNHKIFSNPFRCIDTGISVFVDKIITPVLMVHTKINKQIRPCLYLRDVPFTNHIKSVLKIMKVEKPMTLQTISWSSILRGYSLVMVSPGNSGKSLGYIPAVCRLVSDFNAEIINCEGPTCIIVCATVESVSEVEHLCKMFLGLKEKVVSCYAGMDELSITTSLLNGCDLLICTPCVLARLLQISDFGINLQRLSTFVLDDCERLSEVYLDEIKLIMFSLKKALKTRINKELKIQYVLASRIWCDFMESIAKKAPNTIICIGAFQECVLYSKANTTVNFVEAENKLNVALDFLKEINTSKKTVIVCRDDKEVNLLENVLKMNGYTVYASHSTMSVQDLYNLNMLWNSYEEPITGPILVCCDENLAHMNVTDAHNLLHYSLPQLFSTFCKRFSILNENYASIFKSAKEVLKIKLLIEDTNVEQLPKILHFVKRCTNVVPRILDEISEKVLSEKDIIKAKNLVPICDNLLAFGSCPDFWNCKKRHSIVKDFDIPKEWVPKSGIVRFKILHYLGATLYAVRLISHQNDEKVIKYPKTYTTLCFKLGMYFSNDTNRKLHGIPQIGDICAFALKQNLFVRCQVYKILNYHNGTPNYVLIKLIDEEMWETTKDIYLYHLPDEFKSIETHVVQIRLANVQPRDRDVTYSSLARDELKKITDDNEELYLRGYIAMAVGNCVLVENLEVCQDLSSLQQTVVRYNFKEILLKSHAILNSTHISKLEIICKEAGLLTKQESVTDTKKPVKGRYNIKEEWAHLDCDDFSPVYFASAENPGKFFVRLVKFENCMTSLLKDIEKYIQEENPQPTRDLQPGCFVIAKFPDDDSYERARVDQIIDYDKIKCFFVDQGDWRDVIIKDTFGIPEKFVTKMPFQAIECSLIGIKPVGDDWNEYSTNWFYDNCFEDENGHSKQLFIKHFTKEKAECTGGYKYGVVIIDTYTDKDIVINTLMIEAYLAVKDESTISCLEKLSFEREDMPSADEVNDENWENEIYQPPTKDNGDPGTSQSFLFKQPIRSVPLVNSDDEMSDYSERWDCNMTEDILSMFKPLNQESRETNLPCISNTTSSVESSSKCKDLHELNSDKESPDERSVIKNDKTDTDMSRKPRLLWHQNKKSVVIKIQIVGVQSYTLEIKEKSLKFFTKINEVNYTFDFELYGVVNTKQSYHSNKEQYILVCLFKMMSKNWLMLTKDSDLKSWIIYDTNSIDISSDEESNVDDNIKTLIMNLNCNESESEEDDFRDDAKS